MVSEKQNKDCNIGTTTTNKIMTKKKIQKLLQNGQNHLVPGQKQVLDFTAEENGAMMG